MPSLIGPSHHLYYGYLHRRRLWLGHLSDTFQEYAKPAWSESKRRLDDSFARCLSRLSFEGHLGLLSPLSLTRVLDDTPINSFLTTLSEEFDAYEHNLFELMHQHSQKLDWFTPLLQTSTLWGRELAQESRIAMASANASPQAMPVSGSRSLRGLPSLVHAVLQGGDFGWKPLLFRRRTDSDVQYELRYCAHRKPIASRESADTACRLDSMVYRGFAEAFFEHVRYERRLCDTYCVDSFTLSPAAPRETER